MSNMNLIASRKKYNLTVSASLDFTISWSFVYIYIYIYILTCNIIGGLVIYIYIEREFSTFKFYKLLVTLIFVA